MEQLLPYACLIVLTPMTLFVLIHAMSHRSYNNNI